MILNRKNIIIAAAVIIAAAIAVFFPRSGRTTEPEFSLPTPIVTPQQSPSQADNSDSDLNNENVLAVLDTLNRVDSYIHEMEFVTYWDGGQNTITIHVAADSGRYFIVRNNGTESKKFLSLENDFWIWYGDDKGSAFHGVLTGDRTREIDEFMQFVTYENFVETDGFKALSATLMDYNGLSCIYMEYAHDSAPANTTHLYISVEHGIILSEETTDAAGNPAFSITTTALTITTPPESAFVPPGVTPEETSQP